MRNREKFWCQFPMERLRKVVNQIAYAPPSQRLTTLSPLQLSLIPLLSFASHLYRLAIFIRHRCYQLGFFHKRRFGIRTTKMFFFLILWVFCLRKWNSGVIQLGFFIVGFYFLGSFDMFFLGIQVASSSD